MSDKRIYPAINIAKSGTRKEGLLDKIKDTKSNDELFLLMNK